MGDNDEGFHIVQHFYQQGHDSIIGFAFILLFYACVIWISTKLTLSERDIKGSGIPQVEADLKELMSLSWWSVLWKKYILGVFAIARGLMLGREDPSIQLGAMGAKGIAKHLHLNPVEKCSLIASRAEEQRIKMIFIFYCQYKNKLLY